MNEKQNETTNNFFEGIYSLIEKNKNVIHNIKLFANAEPSYFTHIDFSRIPNISTSLNNKIVEIGNYYKKHNLCFYDFSPLSYIILCDLCNYVKFAFGDLREFFKITNLITSQGAISKMSKKSLKKCTEKFKIGNIRKFIHERKMYSSIQLQQEYIILLNQLKKMHITVEDYLSLDNELFNYNLDKNLADSIINFFRINPDNFTKENIHCIQKELKQLGLSSIIPELYEKLKSLMSNTQATEDANKTPQKLTGILSGLPQPLMDAFNQISLSEYSTTNSYEQTSTEPVITTEKKEAPSTPINFLDISPEL